MLFCFSRDALRNQVLGALAGSHARTNPRSCGAPRPPPQLSLLPEEDFSHTQHELWLAEAYYRTGAAGRAAAGPG